jgi:hypothetical protein
MQWTTEQDPKHIPTCELICSLYFLYIEKKQVRINMYVVDFSPGRRPISVQSVCILYNVDKEHSNIKCSCKMDLPLIGRNSDVLVVNSTGQASKCQY